MCTSGTAAANYLPAAIEATMSRTPLVLLTADRPARLRGTGANQTIDQRALYGAHAAFLDAAVFDDWADLGVHAFDAAVGPPGRAVQVNIAFDEPLVPAGDVPRAPLQVEPWRSPPSPGPASRDLAMVLEHVTNARGAIVAGAMATPAHRVADLAAALGWPLLAEPASNLEGLSAAESLVADATLHPEVVLQVGAAPTTRAKQAFVAAAPAVIVVDPDGHRQDAGRSVVATVAADPDGLAEAVLAASVVPAPVDWLASWDRADRDARAHLDAALDAGEVPETRVARDVAACLPDGAVLVVGNSGPVRDLCVGMVPRAGVRVLANRGASGIDGFVSTVFGVAWSGAPTVGLLGDLTLLHDASGLLWGATHGADAVLVVLNNGGGHIFDRLPSAALPEHEEYFVTPHGVDLGAVVRAAGARHHTVAPDAVAPAVREAIARTGVDVIEVALVQSPASTSI
jgi:2-succinyl-5-enolpyruvyl-6-hydroxy-3-cyclohexene-1-carboxylate synthase